MTTLHPPSRSARLREYFSLQLAFAEHVARVADLPLPHAVAHYTNFHRRFGLGKIVDGATHPDWNRYVERLVRLPDHEARLDWTMAFLDQSPEESLLPGRVGFGCFAYEAPNAQGMVRIHFGNRETGDVGPLHASRLAVRRAELAEMIAHITREHPDATHIDGGSWLYNLEAYRRLFPPAFGASRKTPYWPLTLHGLSSWGQFVDHRGALKRDIAATFLSRFDALDMREPWKIFPYQVLVTTAPIEAFRLEYGVAT
jgi:hypothetical protein